MGRFNSSLTRVQPVFDALLDRPDAGWAVGLWEVAQRMRAGVSIFPPTDFGSFVEDEVLARDSNARRRPFERVLPPPTAFLRWLIQHPEQMTIPDASFGAEGEEAINHRRVLFSPDADLRHHATRKALEELEEKGVTGSRRKWWAFEGFSHIDCCLVTPTTVLFIEGKRTEALSSSTRWYPMRNQLWRNVEVARQFAAGRSYGVILCVETDEAGAMATQDAVWSLAASHPHLAEDDRSVLNQHFIGSITWASIEEMFKLPDSCLPDTTDGG